MQALKLGHTWIIKTNLTTANPITRSNIHEQHLIIPYCLKIQGTEIFCLNIGKCELKNSYWTFLTNTTNIWYAYTNSNSTSIKTNSRNNNLE